MMIRFCQRCNQECDDTYRSAAFSTRLCVDCYNFLCQAVEAEEMDNYEPVYDN